MHGNEVAKRPDKDVGHPQEPGQPTERELLVHIVRNQLLLNSKMFEFVRAYQKQHNWGGDSHVFRDGSGGKTHVADLLDEVNDIGFNLSEAVQTFIGERLFEKRNAEGQVLAHCRACDKETAFAHLIDSPYGIQGAYFSGSERLVCTVCKHDRIYPGDDRLPKYNSVFRTK